MLPSMNQAEAALLHALHSLQKKRSLTDISVNEICIAADVNRAFFYARFQDKDDFLRYAASLH